MPSRPQLSRELLGMLGDRNVVMALLVAAVSSVVLLAYRSANPDNSAEHHYARENHGAYRLMQVCYVVIIASIGFNCRFLLFEAVGAVVRVVAPSSAAKINKMVAR